MSLPSMIQPPTDGLQLTATRLAYLSAYFPQRARVSLRPLVAQREKHEQEAAHRRARLRVVISDLLIATVFASLVSAFIGIVTLASVLP